MEDKEKRAIYNKIDTLNSILWENRVLRPRIEDWLRNFDDEEEKDEALYLLSKCMYFGDASIRILLRALFRDKYRSPLIQEIRQVNGGTLDADLIEGEFRKSLLKTRFLGVGNPSESGVHLLYYFRQENKIPKELFVNTDDIYEVKVTGEVTLREECKDVERIVFIDDLCGSGSQVKRDNNVKRCVENLRKQENSPKISYLMMFGTKVGIEAIRRATMADSGVKLFDEVEAVMELNESYKCFSDKSRYFTDADLKRKTREMAKEYGEFLMAKVFEKAYPHMNEEKRKTLVESSALGFGDCQLLLSLHHNTPNNALPIIWFDEDNAVWTPIFKRYNKI